MYHMKKATVRDLRYRFPQIETSLHDGEEIEITKRKRVIARLVPARKPRKRSRPPDFMARLREIYGSKPVAISGAALVSEQREPY
jgi:antitoxin (DNA-binding transcriptional repressor) of toxin-antitoxin stability system